MFALALVIAFAAVVTWMWALCRAASRDRCECAACREDSSPGRARFGRSATTGSRFSDTHVSSTEGGNHP